MNNEFTYGSYQLLNNSQLILFSSVDGNPIICNCSVKWLQKLTLSDKKILGPLWDQVTCVDPDNPNHRPLLVNVSIPNCGKCIFNSTNIYILNELICFLLTYYTDIITRIFLCISI